MSALITRSWIAALSVLLTASSSAVAQAAGAHWTIQDSAGVAIVENDAPGAWGPAIWSLSETPEASVVQDDSDPDRVWTYIRRAFWLDDGRIGLAVADAPFLRIFDTDGEPVVRLGAEGDGPGEVRAGVWAGSLGDSLALRGPRGLSIYDERGSFARQVALPGGALSEILASAPSGWVLARRRPYDDDHGAGPPQVTAEWVVSRVDRTGDETDVMAEFEQILTWRVQDALWGRLRHAASDGTRVYEVDSRHYEVRTYEDGRLTRLFRAPVPTLPEFTDQHFEAMAEEYGELAERFLASDREAGRLVVPPALAIVVDAGTGEIWIRRTDDGPRATERRWDVFSAEGHWLATLDVPPNLSISEVRRDRVLGVETDELGVTSVHVFRVVRDS